MVASEPKSRTVHVLRGGQITIPIEFRRELGIDDASLMQVTLTEHGELTLRPVETKRKGSEWFRDLYEAFAPVRQEAIDKVYPD
jgi:AbrB family looped-hinge helix DNA binding protein